MGPIRRAVEKFRWGETVCVRFGSEDVLIMAQYRGVIVKGNGEVLYGFEYRGNILIREANYFEHVDKNKGLPKLTRSGV